MAKTPSYKWAFRRFFRRGAFGWRSQTAIQRIRQAVLEIKTVARTDPMLAAEGAVLFLEKVSPAIEGVDSSSGAIGRDVDHAVEVLAGIIQAAPADATTREDWLERLWNAYQNDEIPYLEYLGDHWGTVCASPEVASRWADRLIDKCKMAWGPETRPGSYFKGTPNCLSALLVAKRYGEILDLLDQARSKLWHNRQYGVKALAAMGRHDEALTYAEQDSAFANNSVAIAHVCEDILLSSGRIEEAYARYGLNAHRAHTYLQWFRAVAKTYPHKPKAQVLADLVAHTPGSEGKWFAAAKSAKLFDQAIALANQTPCSPKTLTRAARDFEQKNPTFAIEVGLAALHWLVEGYGYQITSADVLDAYTHTIKAAEHAGVKEQTMARIRETVARETTSDRFVTKALGAHLTGR